ncbi:MAG: PAS domain S-box protein [Bryobacteraceae bacterium]|jgi:PAS domain S-box-containing protein
MGALIRSIDWSATPIGAPESWTPALRMMVRLLLANRFPLLLWWGPQYCQIYNDAYRPVLGDKHPRSMGQRASECFPEIWPIIGPLIDTPFHGGPATWMEDLQLEYIRYELLEEAHFTIAYSPVPDDTVPGKIGGVLATVHEITEKVVGERRLRLLRDLGAESAKAKTAAEACSLIADTFSQDPKDIPFALVYLMDGERRHARLSAVAGIAVESSAAPVEIDLASPTTHEQPWPLAQAMRDDAMQFVGDLQTRLVKVPPGPWGSPPRSAAVLPIRSNIAHQPEGFLVFGISSRLRFDDAYRWFCELLTSQVATAIASANRHEEERKKTEALAEIDRAKTTFFSNVSHEFRTPLTLILGAVEAAARRAEGSVTVSGQDLDLIRRNTLRLLKLVNMLLDFSRIEADRMAAFYEPVDLPAFTAELAGVFRSAIEKGGLRLSVDCPALGEPVYVDRAMWEKIVLNLLSNAFKFTFEGEIAVSLRQSGQCAELAISDTGTGIPERELPHLFERFHRVEGARGRTYEGSGIGLALVQELAKIHGGAVHTESMLGQGSRFVVSIPLGRAHLPPDHVSEAERSHTVGARAYLEEALHWLPGASNAVTATEGSQAFSAGGQAFCAPSHRPRVLLADDNADMRQYLERLLTGNYEVHSVGDGETALAEALRNPPDLVLADVMMPRMDGFALLRALRSDPRSNSIPVILVSARAGEESRVQGLEQGADDYMVKPFSARELLARVSARLEITQLNRETLREQDLRQRAEEVERRTKIILESITDGFVAVDSNWRYTYVNAAAEQIFGRDRHEMLGRTVWEVFPEAADTRFALEFRRSMTARVPVVIESYFEPMDRWFAANGYPSADGGLAIYFRDVTREKRAEEALVDKERFIHQIADLTPAVISVFDLAVGHETYISRGVETLLGYTPDEIARMKDPLSTLCHPDDVLRCRDDLTQLKKIAAGIFEMEYRMRRRDGQWRWLASRITAFSRNANGEVGQLIAATLDVTARKETEEALCASEERFRRYFELGLIGMAITSPDKGCLEVNDEICRILGYERSELLNKTWAEMTHPDDLAADFAQFERVMAGEIGGYTLDKRWIRKGGQVIDSTVSVKCLRRGDGSVAYFVALLQDITARKQTEAALERSQRELELRVVRRTRQLSDLNEELLKEIVERKRAEMESLALREAGAAELAAMTRLHELSIRLLASTELKPLMEEVLDATMALQSSRGREPRRAREA